MRKMMFGTKSMPAIMYIVGGIAFKNRVIAFVDRKMAESAGVNIGTLTSPYELWNSRLPKDTYSVFLANTEKQVQDLSAENDRFRSLRGDRRYAEMILYFNN